ncbi:MAG: biotin synthase BioB [Chitinophagales bacterium]|nr:biotin synthase BioB [Chitinophagales bacterium]
MERWTKAQISDIYNKPLLQLMYESSEVYKNNFEVGEIVVNTLLSVKTGGCPEDCSYCSQSSKYVTDVKASRMMKVEAVKAKAKEAKANGTTRFCISSMGTRVRDNHDFDNVLEMVKAVREEGLEVCCTLGMLNPEQAGRLKDAGLNAYNHNVDTSDEYYDKIITTRTYKDRLETLEAVAGSGLKICSGGIIGMGETDEDRVGMLHTLANLPAQPESVPINCLVPIKGTPLEQNKRVDVWEMLRMVATARITMPQAVVRISAGREIMSLEEQALCFMAGANSIFAGNKLLTTPNPEIGTDNYMFNLLGLKPRPSSVPQKSSADLPTIA